MPGMFSEDWGNEDLILSEGWEVEHPIYRMRGTFLTTIVWPL